MNDIASGIDIPETIEVPKAPTVEELPLPIPPTDEDAISAAKRQYEEKVRVIQDKYQEVMDKVDKLNKTLNEKVKEADNAIKNGQSWMTERINSEIEEIQSEIDVYKKNAEDWMNAQMKKAEDWMNAQIKRATDFVTNLSQNTLDASNEFLKKQVLKKTEAKLKALK